MIDASAFAYDSGPQPPPSPSFASRLSLSPTIAKTGGGLSFAGSF